DESRVPSLIGQKMRVEINAPRPAVAPLLTLLNLGGQNLSEQQRRTLEGLAGKLPQALAKMDLTESERKVLADLSAGGPRKPEPPGVEGQGILGVYRDVVRSEQSPWDGGIRGVDVMVPPDVGERMHFSRPGSRAAGLPYVVLRVDDERNLKQVQEAAAQDGLEAFSLAEVVDQVRLTVLLISAGCTLVALTALTVAGLGITNTMLMSVLQRTHEIGVMKAVGARDGQVMLLFLLEGAL